MPAALHPCMMHGWRRTTRRSLSTPEDRWNVDAGVPNLVEPGPVCGLRAAVQALSTDPGPGGSAQEAGQQGREGAARRDPVVMSGLQRAIKQAYVVRSTTMR